MTKEESYFSVELPLMTVGATLEAVSRIERQEMERIAQERERIRVNGFFEIQGSYSKRLDSSYTREQLTKLDATEKRLTAYIQSVKQFLLTLKQ
ncbi:MAG: hypothetical protein IK077_16535 [Thermoguttaceae bacterium]|nr:hypothetical protein [Thermoguttaceae bacterium]